MFHYIGDTDHALKMAEKPHGLFKGNNPQPFVRKFRSTIQNMKDELKRNKSPQKVIIKSN